ncbi:MAG: LysR family transcriptional regulator [Colwellia sp.]
MNRNLRSIDFNLLTIFAGLMRDKNLSHTAENLGMTQPAVSQALKRLRSLYNDPLFERKGGKMQPTRQAETIYPTVNKALESILTTLPDPHQFEAKKAELEFHINILGLDNQLFLSNIVQRVAKEAPNIALTITSDVLDDPEQALRNKEYDLHIDYLPIKETGCHHQILITDQLFVVANKSHPRLADKKNLLLSDYLAEKHAVLTPRKDNVYPLKKMITDFNNDRIIKYTSTNIQSILEVVGATDYLCIVPGIVFRSMKNVEDFIYFTPPFKTNEINVFVNWHWTMEHNKPLRWLRKIIVEVFNELTSEVKAKVLT